MLYLAEVKKQTRNFLSSGLKTDLKLLACQHSDQTWSALPNEEAFSVENMESANEGTLWVLRLVNRQVQGTPEVAAPELVRQLQKLSRLSEKLKDQQEEIEQWKQSLTYQSQELARREMEIDGREADIDEKVNELKQLERQKQEVDQAWKRLENERQQLLRLQQQFGYLIDLAPNYAEKIQLLLGRLAQQPAHLDALNTHLQHGLTAIQRQQEIFNQYWQDLATYRHQIAQQEQALQYRKTALTQKRQDLENSRTELEKAKQQLAIEQATLQHYQELLRRLNVQYQMADDLQNRLYRLASSGTDGGTDHKLDLEALESMPLGELEERIKHLQADLDKLVRFVNDQEEELSLQCQAVDELEIKLSQAGEYERLGIEEELAEEQERKGMLDRTLVGQRHNLKERQEVLMQYLRVLRRRQGVLDIDTPIPTINLEPTIEHIEGCKRKITSERSKLEADMQYRQSSLQQIQEMTANLDQEQAQKYEQLHQEEEAWEQQNREFIQVQTQLTLYEQTLQPLQDQLDQIRPQMEHLSEMLLTG